MANYYDKYQDKGLVYRAYNPKSKVLIWAFAQFPHKEQDFYYKHLNALERTRYLTDIHYAYKRNKTPSSPTEWYNDYTMKRDVKEPIEPLQEMADKLGMSVNAFQALTQRAMAKIKNYLEANPAKAQALSLELAYFSK